MKPIVLKKSLEILASYIEKPENSLVSRFYDEDSGYFLGSEVFSEIIRYLNEIVRYFNSIHYVTEKICRSLRYSKVTPFQRAEIYYLVYRIRWEHILPKDLQEEFQFFYSKGGSAFRLIWGSRLNRLIRQISQFSWDIALLGKSQFEQFSLTAAIPTFFIERLQNVMSWDKIQANVHAMDPSFSKNVITIRINQLFQIKSHQSVLTREDYCQLFKQFDISTIPDSAIPFLFSVPYKDRAKIIKSSHYKKGALIFQDRASVISGILLDPQPNELILDICAAPGIKTSLIQQLAHNLSRCIAGDIRIDRLLSMRTLMKHLKVQHVHLVNWDGFHLPLRSNQKMNSPYFDKILLDPPCSGSGTFLTDPELKWRQNWHFLHQTTKIQQNILTALHPFLSAGTVLVYSTCSLYPEEGEDQFTLLAEYEWFRFLVKCPLLKGVSFSYIGQSPQNTQVDNLTKSNDGPASQNSIPIGQGRMFPAIQRTQGFFYAKYAYLP